MKRILLTIAVLTVVTNATNWQDMDTEQRAEYGKLIEQLPATDEGDSCKKEIAHADSVDEVFTLLKTQCNTGKNTEQNDNVDIMYIDNTYIVDSTDDNIKDANDSTVDETVSKVVTTDDNSAADISKKLLEEIYLTWKLYSAIEDRNSTNMYWETPCTLNEDLNISIAQEKPKYLDAMSLKRFDNGRYVSTIKTYTDNNNVYVTLMTNKQYSMTDEDLAKSIEDNESMPYERDSDGIWLYSDNSVKEVNAGMFIGTEEYLKITGEDNETK